MKDLLHLHTAPLRRLLRLGRARDEIAEEMRFHLAMEAERLEATGKSRSEAEQAALASFGDLQAIERECRRITGGIPENTAFEIRSAARTLASDRRAASIAFAGLTISLALLAFAFSLFDTAVLRPLPYRDSDRMVRLWTSVPGIGPEMRWGIAKAQFLFFQRESRSYSALGLYVFESVTARTGEEKKPSRITAMIASDGTLDALGVRPLLGRGISSRDNVADEPSVAVVSYAMWESRFNRDLKVLGKTLDVNGKPVRIVGVLPRDVVFPEELEQPDFAAPSILLPLRLKPSDAPRNNHVYRAIGLLKPGTDRADAANELQQLVARLPHAIPAVYSKSFMRETGFGIEVLPLSSGSRDNPARPFFAMLGAAALLIALACSTAASMRTRDAHERLAPFSTEMVLLTAVAAVASLPVAAVALELLAQPDFPAFQRLTITARSAAFTLLIAGIAAVLLSTRKISHGAGRRSSTLLRTFTRSAAAAPLVAFAIMSRNEARDLDATSPGFNAADAAATRIHLPATYSSHEAVAAFDERVMRRLRSIEGVDAVGMTSALPLTGFDGCSGVTAGETHIRRCVPVYFVTPDYLRALGVPVRGREPKSHDESAAVVSATFAQHMWPNVDAIGKTLSLGPSSRPYRVVGVANDVKSRGLDKDPAPDVYVPMSPITGWNGWQPITSKTVIVRSRQLDVHGVRAAVLDAIREADATADAGSTQSLAALVDGSTGHRDLPVSFISVAALAALLLCIASVQPIFFRRAPRHT